MVFVHHMYWSRHVFYHLKENNSGMCKLSLFDDRKLRLSHRDNYNLMDS